MLGAMASIQAQTLALAAFANGGIVGGDAFHGDSTLVRANKGEMILTTSQQHNLFKALNGASFGLQQQGEVKFKLRGQELVGLMTNYTNKKARIR